MLCFHKLLCRLSPGSRLGSICQQRGSNEGRVIASAAGRGHSGIGIEPAEGTAGSRCGAETAAGRSGLGCGKGSGAADLWERPGKWVRCPPRHRKGKRKKVTEPIKKKKKENGKQCDVEQLAQAARKADVQYRDIPTALAEHSSKTIKQKYN